MLDGSRGSAKCGRGQGRCTVFTKEDRRTRDRDRRPYDCPKILRILDLIESNPNEIGLAQKILEIRKSELWTPSDDPLMLSPVGESIEGFSWYPRNVDDPLVPCEALEGVQTGKMSVIDENAGNGFSVDANEFSNGLQSGNVSQLIIGIIESHGPLTGAR
jgi:hypothetical protein